MKKKEERLGAKEAPAVAESEFSLIPRETLLSLYASLLGRRSSNAGGSRSRADRGWSAVLSSTVAVAKDLAPGDLVCGLSEAALGQLMPSLAKAGKRRSGSQQKLTPEEELRRALGTAVLNKAGKNGKVVVVFWRETAMAPWRNALEAARVHALPILFVAPAQELQPKFARNGKNHDMEPGTELPQIRVDGYDAVAVYRVAHEAIERARRARGATLIECTSYAVKGQSRRTHEDAVANMERYLRGKGMFRAGLREEVLREFRSKGKSPRRAVSTGARS